MADAKYPGTGTFKALMVDGSTRVACTSNNCATGGTAEQIDWVFSPSTIYIRTDGTLIGSTNSLGLLTFPLTNDFSAATSFTDIWTGLGGNWTTSPNTCAGWSNGTNTVNGSLANASQQTSDLAVTGATAFCINPGGLIACVEQ